MSASVNRAIWDRHPLWSDRERLEAINQKMWFEIQKVMFPGKARRPLPNTGGTELTVVGGISPEDVYREAVHGLLQYEPAGEVNWEAVAISIARRRAIQAVRTATKYRTLGGGSEIGIVSLDREVEGAGPLVTKLADSEDLTDDEAVDRVLRAERLVAFHAVAHDVLTPRDRDIVFRKACGETYLGIAADVGVTEQRVGQIYRESMRKINARLRSHPEFRRLYQPEGGDPDA
jgi:DNA-directed RNA polymerase specialized sigma24 family protein